MIKPPPLKFICLSCNWQQTTYPRSDALGPGDYFSACPKCGNPKLEITAANSLKERLLALFKNQGW